MEAIQGQMQLYNSVAGPVPGSTFISFTTPPGMSNFGRETSTAVQLAC